MAQNNTAKAEKEIKVKRILGNAVNIPTMYSNANWLAEFSSSIPSKIHNGAIDPPFEAELRTHIYNLPIKTGTAHTLELDSGGTELWDLAMSLDRDQNLDTNRKKTMHLLRTFAFFLIDSSYIDRVRSLDKCVRLLKVAFTSAEGCFDQHDLDFAIKVLERAAHYVEIISQESAEIRPEDMALFERLKAGYFFHRMILVSRAAFLCPIIEC